MAPPKFRNSEPHEERGVWDILRWKIGLPPHEKAQMPDAPDGPADRILLSREDLAVPLNTGWRVIWLGHASFLLQGAGVSLLIDPIFSNHCSPVKMPSLRRLVLPPCALADLPPIHTVLLTHTHYDHLDLSTLRALGPDVRLVVAEGHADWLRRAGFLDVAEVPWFGNHALTPEIRVTATPAQHFTARTPWDRNCGHWCGWMIQEKDTTLWHAGDSAYCEGFREIGERFGPIDFGMIPIGAYQPRYIMRSMHMNPEEAVQVFKDTQCRLAVAMHWGTFRLTDEPMGEPPLRLAAAMDSNQLAANRFIAGAVGQSWLVNAER